MVDSIRLPRRNFFAPDDAESLDGIGVVGNVPATLHVDLSATMVYVANLLRLRGRNGDFYFLDERGSFAIEI